MNYFLEVINGRYAGTTEAVGIDEVLLVGSSIGADLCLPTDDFLEPLHFMIRNEPECARLESLGGSIFVNNRSFSKGGIVCGDFVFAGGTLFRLTAEGAAPPDETALDKLIAHLSGIGNLGLLIDENLDPSISPILRECKATFRQLKPTIGSDALLANPLLVMVNGKPRLLETLVRSFWGKGFLVFFEPIADFGKTAEYFGLLLERALADAVPRFYDPRFLRVVLGEADSQTARRLFGAASRFLVESQLPSHLLDFAVTNGVVSAGLLGLSERCSN